MGSFAESILVVPDVNVLMLVHSALHPRVSSESFTRRAIAANAEAKRLRPRDLELKSLSDTDASLGALATALVGTFQGLPVTLHSGVHIRDTFLHKTEGRGGQDRWNLMQQLFFAEDGQMDLGVRSATHHPPLDYEDGKVNGLADYYAGQNVFADVLILTCDKPFKKFRDQANDHRGVFAITPQSFVSRQLAYTEKKVRPPLPNLKHQ